MGLEWVAPSIAAGAVIIGALVTGLLNRRSNKYSSDSDHAPDVMEAWREADRARALARRWEDMYYLVRNALKGYARRMFDAHGDVAALNDRERIALETEPPELPEVPKEKTT